jgi:hypothetical protein
MPKYLCELSLLTRSTALIVVESDHEPDRGDLREAYREYDFDWSDDPEYAEEGQHGALGLIEGDSFPGITDLSSVPVFKIDGDRAAFVEAIVSIEAFCKHLGIDGTDIETARKRVFKDTECGASLHYLRGEDEKVIGIEVGTIVEGVDQETEYLKLHFPFTTAEWDEAIEHVETEAQLIWDNTHGCEQCGPEDEGGFRTINPKCPGCNGAGIVI